MLHMLTWGTPGPAPDLMIAHGLFGSARNWGGIARALADRGRIVAVDLRNHGQSPWSPAHGYADLAADLAEVAGTLAPPVDVLGHSMGGKAAMALALTHPAQVRRLVVADIAPVAYGHSPLPLVAAMQAVRLDDRPDRAEADRRLAAAGVGDAGLRAFLLGSLDLRADPPRWRLNLTALAANMAAITGWPEFPGRFEGPALFLAGAASDYVRPEHRAAIRRWFPAARIARIPGAGHWLQADRPEAVAAAVRAFLDAP